jgi:membrane protein DedA with SNARE-associated domain
LFFTLLGYFLGATFDSFTKYSKYLNLAIATTLIFGIVLFVLYKKLSKKLSKKEKDKKA